ESTRKHSIYPRICYAHAALQGRESTAYGGSSGAASSRVSTRAMKASRSSTVWKWTAWPDSTCSPRPARCPCATAAVACTCTTKARCTGNGWSAADWSVMGTSRYGIVGLEHHPCGQEYRVRGGGKSYGNPAISLRKFYGNPTISLRTYSHVAVGHSVWRAAATARRCRRERTPPMAETHEFHFGAFRLDLRSEQLWCGTAAVRLRPKSFAVLHYLVAHPGRVIPKDELLQAVSPHTAVRRGAPTGC